MRTRPDQVRLGGLLGKQSALHCSRYRQTARRTGSVPSGRRTGRVGQLVVHAVPLSVNDVGTAFTAPFVPMKPTVTEPAAGIVAV